MQFTGNYEDYINIDQLPSDANFFEFQRIMNPTIDIVPSHNVIGSHIKCFGEDYRFEDKENTEKTLRDRSKDNTELARKKGY